MTIRCKKCQGVGTIWLPGHKTTCDECGGTGFANSDFAFFLAISIAVAVLPSLYVLFWVE